MSNIMGVELNLNQEYIKGAVEDIVKAGIVQALGDPSDIVKRAIDQTINQKVDRDGKPSRDSWNTIPYLQWLAEKTVKETVAECIKEYIQDHQEEFKTEVLKQLSNPNFRKDVAVKFLNTITNAADSRYSMPISVSFKTNDD